MPDLTITQRFGSSVAFDGTTKVLSINLNDLTDGGDLNDGNGLDITGLSQANINIYASKILWALLLLSQANQPETNNDETVGVYITNEGKRSFPRNNVSQFGYRLVATGFKNDTSGINLDPDAIAS